MVTANKTKLLNIETWSVETVCKWLIGIGEKVEIYKNNFEINQINGNKLMMLEKSDLLKIGIEILDHRITIYNSIQNLIQCKDDLYNETMDILISSVKNRAAYIISYLERLHGCEYKSSSCKICEKLKNDIIKMSSTLTTSYRRLLSWLARLPFTRVDKIDKFRDEINAEMKALLKLFRKCLKTDSFFLNLGVILSQIFKCCDDISNICNIKYLEKTPEETAEELKMKGNGEKPELTKIREEENKILGEELAKNSVIFNHCSFDKVVIRKKFSDQYLGLSLVNLIDGVFTVGEIAKDSASDECSRLNVGDDILAINDQVIIGWNSLNIDRLLELSFENNTSFVLLLRKMPRENTPSLKQLAAINNIRTFPREKKRASYKDCRKHSLADLFLSDNEFLDIATSEDEDDYEKPIYGMTKQIHHTDSRRIQSMQNLAINKSRSNSVDLLDNNEVINQSLTSNTKKQRKKSEDTDSTRTDYTSKSDIIRSIFSNNKKSNINSDKRDLFHRKKQNSEYLSETNESSTPNLLNVRRLDSKPCKNVDNNNNSTNCSTNNLFTKNSTNPISSKPPLDNKKLYKLQQKQKPTYQSWLYKRKPEDKAKHHDTFIRMINSKWQKFWCTLMKDYIIFNKHPDEKTPKDYILLKDFEIKKGTHQYGFIIVDNTKDITHEFYADSNDEYNMWYQYLVDLKVKVSNTDYSSLQSPQYKQTFDDELNKMQSNQVNSVLQSNTSSRESSPGVLNSRDSSPILHYPSLSNCNSKNGFTSESEYDLDISKQQSSPSLLANTQNKFDSLSNLPNLKPKTKDKFLRKESSFNDLNSAQEDQISDQIKNKDNVRTLNKKLQSNSFDSYNDDKSIEEEQEQFSSLPGSLQNSYFKENFTKSDTPPPSFLNSVTATPPKCIKSTSPALSIFRKSSKDDQQILSISSSPSSINSNNSATSSSHPPASYSRQLPLLASILTKRKQVEALSASPTVFRTEITIMPSTRVPFIKNNQKTSNL